MVVILAAVSVALDGGGTTQGQGSSASGSSTVKSESSPAPAPPPPTTRFSLERLAMIQTFAFFAGDCKYSKNPPRTGSDTSMSPEVQEKENFKKGGLSGIYE
ncbi:hypothetical protein EV127DRAFT_480501 [Xylaria flabelliformis]|nr:hypothetical protein EV127DRAFT_480501 [Xylaria flabelliformis]